MKNSSSRKSCQDFGDLKNSKRKSFQFDNGDYLSFFDGRNLQSHQIQKLHNGYKNIKHRTISSSGKYMLVQFLTNEKDTSYGFKLTFNYMPIEPNCGNWLDMTAQILKSPDNPTINCSWVIIASSIGSNCTINFETFEVKCTWITKFIQLNNLCTHLQLFSWGLGIQI